MKLTKLSSTLFVASTMVTSLMTISPVKAEDNAALFGQLAGKIQCSTADVALGSDIKNDIQRDSSSRQTSSSKSQTNQGGNSQSQSSSKSHNDGGGGSVSVLGLFSVGGSGGSKGSSNSSSKSSSSYFEQAKSAQSSKSSNSHFHYRSTSTVVKGQVKDCDSNNAAAAAIITTLDTNKTAKEINVQDNITARYGIDAQVKINSDNNKAAIEMFKSQRKSGAVNNLLQWQNP
ncbi:MAG: hypothetical protein WCD18_14740 [Thermosynechococcaceae cyanobacterium]